MLLVVGLVLGLGRRLTLGGGHRRVHRDEITRGERLVAALHDDVGEVLVERFGVGVAVIVRGLAGEDAAQHPTRAIHADDARVHSLAALDGDRQVEFGAEHARVFGCLLVGLEQIGAHVVPQTHGLGRRERLDLQAGRAVADGRAEDLLGAAVRLDAQLQAREIRQVVGAHVEVLVVIRHVLVIDVPRSVGFAAAFVRVLRGLRGIDGGLVLAILGLRFGFLAFTLLLAESKQSHGFLISLYRLQP